MGLLDGKKALIVGVANDKSIAWNIAQKLKEHGCELAFTYAGEAFKGRVTPLAESLGSEIVLPMDVTNDAEMDSAFSEIADKWGGLDILVHAVAFANKDELKGSFSETSREGFALALDVSAFSLVALSRRAKGLMEGRDGSIITLSYLGSERVIKNYNVMGVAKAALESSVKYLAADLGGEGIRVNAISAGPVKTLAAMGISGFRDILEVVKEKSPLRRNITASDVGKTAVYLSSELSSGVTGEILYVDSGFNVVGL